MILSVDYSIFCRNQPKTRHQYLFVTACILIFTLLGGCNSHSIHFDEQYNPPVYFGVHMVRAGESIYGIARRYGRDFRELASANGIAPPYVIQAGQKIDLELRGNEAATTAVQIKKELPRKVNVTESKQSNRKIKSVTKDKNHKNFKEINWAWPHVGPILAKYTFTATDKKSNLSNKGIDIGGRIGDPIYAAAPGEVVYAGSGLLGYGNLVIITHDDRYLSAYAHNRTLLVTEGQRIEQGQKIAELGASGADKPMLHFEIRRDGQPVDPLKYLPKK